MAVSPDGILFVAERGADRVVALPDDDADETADPLVEVGVGHGRGQDLAFTDDGTLLVASEAALWAVTLDGLREVERRTVVGGCRPAASTRRSRSPCCRMAASCWPSAPRATSARRRMRVAPPSNW